MSTIKQNFKFYEVAEFKEVEKSILADLIKSQTRPLKSMVLEEQDQLIRK